MSEEKTEQPTPKKLKDARKDGQVAHSKEVVSASVIIAVMAYFYATSDFYIKELKAMLLLPKDLYRVPFADAVKLLFNELGIYIAKLMLPLLALVFVVAVAANAMQVGFLIAFKSITPDVKKLNPVEGAKKIFSMKNLVEVIKAILKIIILGSIVFFLLRNYIEDLMQLPYCDSGCIMPLIGHIFRLLFMYATAAFIIIAAADYFFQKRQYIKQLRMTKDEIKREYKETEGSPEIKSKRKQIHRELLYSDMKSKVKKSTAIVTNPTHVAVGIYYKEGNTKLPVVTIKGTDYVAMCIKEMAKEEGIPIMENVPLARALLAEGKIGAYIPSNLIEPIVEVLKWVRSQEQR